MRESSKDILWWGVFYLIAHGGILLIPDAIYWDDWVIYRSTEDVIHKIFQEAGSMFDLAGYLHVSMLGIGPWFYKLLTFFLMFASGILVNSIVKRHSFITVEARFYIVLLFLVLPLNAARVALIDFPYTLCYFLFFLSWAMMDRFRIVALGAFFLSFNTNSLLCFYALPILDMFYRSGALSGLKPAFAFLIRRLDYILLPFIFFYIKVRFYAPSGVYENYNQHYSLKNIFSLPVHQFYDFMSIDVNIGLALFLSIFCFLVLRTRSLVDTAADRGPRMMLVLGLAVFVLGAFPYWIVGLVPTFLEWSSRHQLLLPLGSSLVIVSICSFSRASGRAGFVSAIVGASLAFNVSTYCSLFSDWQKQRQLIHLFASNADVERAGLIVVEDKTERINALMRKYRPYEWNGILEVAFGDQKRFSIQKSEYKNYLTGEQDFLISERYKAGAFRKDSGLPQVLVVIDFIKPKKLGEKIVNRLYPKLALTVSDFGRTDSNER